MDARRSPAPCDARSRQVGRHSGVAVALCAAQLVENFCTSNLNYITNNMQKG